MRQICYDAVTHLVKDFPKEIMNLLHDNIEDFGFDYGHSSWLLEELGKHNLQQCLDVTEDWINEQQDFRIKFHLPTMINALIPQRDCNKAFSYIEKLIKNTPTEEMGSKYPAERIADIIRSNFQENTKAVAVLLGRNLENPPTASPQYTHNWVNFEVGIAAACNKPVWVFEDFKDFIQFPIPFVSDYCRYTLGDKNHLLNIGEFLKTMVNSPQQFINRKKIRCTLCNANYKIWDSEKKLNCPVCRQNIIIPD